MDHNEVSIRCIELAREMGHWETKRVIDAARELRDFVYGRRDTEIIRAAQSVAEAVNPGREDR
jgi:hypothetical protein